MNILFYALFNSIIIFFNVPLMNIEDCLEYNSGKEPTYKIMYTLEKIEKTDNIVKIVYSLDREEYQISYVFGTLAKDLLLYAKEGDIVKYDHFNKKPVLVLIRKNEVSVEVRYFYLCTS